ncbi:MAG: phosphomannomutase/phosphoglucomutase [bacterium]|nr:phosphomannomutase/phosphoglucomutase [bacterium]
MTVQKEIFREYDIRGAADTQLTDEISRAIGQAYASFILEKGVDQIVVGADNRVSSPRIKTAVIDGVVSQGVSVVDIGTAVTPMVYFAGYHLNLDGGIQVTASHNPAEDNGIKMREKKKPLFVGGTQMIYERIIAAGPASALFRATAGKPVTSSPHSVSASPVGGSPAAGVSSKDISEDYIKRITRGIKLGRKLKVVVDTGNGTGGLFVRRILDMLGVDATVLFEESDGTFPNHTPNPQEVDDYGQLQIKVREIGADVGIALDGDCDRMNATDETGTFLGGDKLAVLFSREVLRSHKGAGVVINPVMSQAIFDDVESAGGKGYFGKVGYPNIESRMRETGALMGVESSGHFFFGDDYYGYDDALYAMVRLLSFVSQSTESVTDILADMPRYVSTPEYRVDVRGTNPDVRKFDMVSEVTKAFQDEKYDVNTIDGARVTFPDRSSRGRSANGRGWGIVRASNTQPKLSMRFESKTEKGLGEIQRIFREKLKEYREIKVEF